MINFLPIIQSKTSYIKTLKRMIFRSLLSVLPFYNFVYSMGGISLEYVDQEKDLGVIVTSNLDWKDQCSKVLSKANQKLGMARRNCYFVQDVNRRRVLYLTLVRSLFEHCSVIYGDQSQNPRLASWRASKSVL